MPKPLSIQQITEQLNGEQEDFLLALPVDLTWTTMSGNALTDWAVNQQLLEHQPVASNRSLDEWRLTTRGMAVRAWMCGRDHTWDGVPMVPCLWPLGWGSVMVETVLTPAEEEGELLGLLRLRAVPDAYQHNDTEVGSPVSEEAWQAAAAGPELMLTFRTPQAARAHAQRITELADAWEKEARQ